MFKLNYNLSKYIFKDKYDSSTHGRTRVSPHTVETEIGESQGLGVIWSHITIVYQRKKINQ